MKYRIPAKNRAGFGTFCIAIMTICEMPITDYRTVKITHSYQISFIRLPKDLFPREFFFLRLHLYFEKIINNKMEQFKNVPSCCFVYSKMQSVYIVFFLSQTQCEYFSSNNRSANSDEQQYPTNDCNNSPGTGKDSVNFSGTGIVLFFYEVIYSRTEDQQTNQKANDFIHHFCFLLHFSKNAELVMTRTDPAL